jgi:endoglucanase
MNPVSIRSLAGRPVRRLALLAALAAAAAPSAVAAADNYAEALQKSIYFYDAEKSGPGITGGRLEWRGDSEVRDGAVPLKPKGADNIGTNLSQAFITANRAVLDPDGDGAVDLSGGMHDAGDHVKFGLPQSYAASTLAWGLYEFRDAFVKTGQEAHMLEILKWFSDYFLRSTFRNSAGEVVAFNYQVGEGSVDHTVWAPPELLNLPRPAYFASSETPASDQAAGAAAALALMYLNYKSVDLSYANRCLETAQALYRFAVKYRGLGYSGGFYGSSDDNDELSWAAVWLYTATGTQSYITDISAVSADGKYTGYLSKIVKSTQDNWQNIWVHSWDTVWGGVFVQLANLFPDDTQYDYYARWNLEYWSGGAVPHRESSDGNYLAKTPAGFAFINSWGSARYNAAAQLCALIYGKHTSRTDFAEWARGQMAYIMGANPFKYSLIVGYPTPEQSCEHPHHRAAHGSTTNSMLDPVNHKHVLWGALCGGPDAKDVHNDLTTDFVSNEVAIDYNAGLVGALAGLYSYDGAGQSAVASFPPAEPAEAAYTVKAKIEQENKERTQVTITINAQPTHPPHFVHGLTARYYFDISELIAAGQTISALHTAVYYDEQASGYGGSVTVRGPIAVDAAKGVYYMELDWGQNDVYGKRDLQLALWVDQDATWKSNWDPTNDWSRQGLTTAAGGTTYIPMYLDGTRVSGQEPSGGSGGGGGGGTSSALTVTRAGTGSGTVTSTPAGVSCGTTCSASFASTATVTLSAAAASGSTFAGWSGACSGTAATCTVAMSAARAVTATFNTSSGGTTNTLAVAKAGTGSGTVTSSPSGVSCGTTCSAGFAGTATVTLSAAAASGSTFAGWSGACTGTAATCTVAMSAARSVTATFNTSSGGGTAPCSDPVTITNGQSGNFNTTGAICLRTSATVNGWGCSNFAGRTVSVNGGTAASTCGTMPAGRSADGYTYFSVSAGTYPWASLYYW